MSKARQHQDSEEVRNRILEITQRIIWEEGMDAISIRRVAKDMDYSAAIIYHYFRDKNQLLSRAIQAGYRKILASAKPPDLGLPPDEALRASFKNFVDGAMLVPQAYRSFILNFSPELLAETSVLEESEGEKSPTLAKIISTLEAGIELGLFSPCDVRLTAKAFWSAIFGLFFRLVVEPNIPPAEREALIQRQLDMLLKGIAA